MCPPRVWSTGSVTAIGVATFAATILGMSKMTPDAFRIDELGFFEEKPDGLYHLSSIQRPQDHFRLLALGHGHPHCCASHLGLKRYGPDLKVDGLRMTSRRSTRVIHFLFLRWGPGAACRSRIGWTFRAIDHGQVLRFCRR